MVYFERNRRKRGKTMTQQEIQRINELAHKAKAQGLTQEEKEEQARLRRAYIDAVKASLKSQLDSIEYVDDKK